MKKIILYAICVISSLTFATTNAQVIDEFPYTTGDITSEAQLDGWTSNDIFIQNTYGLRIDPNRNLTSPELKGGFMTISVVISNVGSGNYLYLEYSYDGINFQRSENNYSLAGTTTTYPIKLPFGTKKIRIFQGSSSTNYYCYVRSITITNEEASLSGTYKNLTWTLSGVTGNAELNINGTGAMPDFANHKDSIPWYNYKEGITKLTIGSGITSIGNNACRNMLSLKDIIIPEGITHIGNNAFSGCTGTTSLYIPNSVTTIGSNAFSDMTNLDYVLLGTGLKTVGNSAFYGCTNLTLVKMSATDCRTFGEDVWLSCSALKTFLFTENVRTIPDNIFSNLTDGFHLRWQNGQSVDGYDDYDYNDRVAIPPTIKRIGKRAFFNTRFSRIELPASVDTIDAEAFKDNIYLYELCSDKTKAPVLAGGLVFHNIDKATCRLVVPASAYNSYAAAPQWRDFMLIVDPSYSNAMLKNIAVNDSPVEDFDGGVHTYYMNVPFSVSSITLNAEAAGAGSTVEGVGTFDLNVGLNVFFITVTAADGVSTMTYSIGVTRAPDPLFVNAFLQSLLVDGISVVNFNSEVYTYSMNVP
ncbi:MAG: leucine-rich repeat protein, partial [Bacteroidales bacterium]|nr:leucine-rich repeat protein [Bacteroidales bacterium]